MCRLFCSHLPTRGCSRSCWEPKYELNYDGPMCHKPVRESYSSDEKTLVSQETLSIRKFKHLDNVYFLVYAGKKSLSTKSSFQFTRPNVQQHPEKRVIEEVICRRVSNDYTRSRASNYVVSSWSQMGSGWETKIRLASPVTVEYTRWVSQNHLSP